MSREENLGMWRISVWCYSLDETLKEEELLLNLASAIKLDWMKTCILEQSAFFRWKWKFLERICRNQKAISLTKQSTASIMAILLLIMRRVVGTGAHLWPLFHQKQPSLFTSPLPCNIAEWWRHFVRLKFPPNICKFQLFVLMPML